MKRIALAGLLLFAGSLRFCVHAEAPAPAIERKQTVSLRFSKHARQRMLERHVAPEVVLGIVETVASFKYYYQGRWKTGYYDPDKQIFIAADGAVVITVITDATPRYVAGLKSKKP